MSVVDLHPEDLLDRDARGELTAAESERLARHLSQCTSCRLEHRVRSDFRLEEEALGPDFDVQRLLSEVLAPGTDRELLRVPTPRRRSPIHRFRPLLLIAAALLIAGVSAAAGWKGIRVIQVLSSLSLSASETPPAPAGPSLAPRAPPQESTATRPAPSASITESPPAAPPPPATPATAPPAAVATPAIVPKPVDPSSAAPRAQPAASASASATASDAALLFNRANGARRSGSLDHATELYRALMERYPESAEAHESQAVLGHLLLGDSDAGAALRYFDAYLRTGGALEEDVMADRASALSRLGRAHDEAEAWTSLLHAYPRTVHEGHARARLRELGDP